MEFNSTPLVFFVNGRKVVENEPNPEQLLVNYLRTSLGLTGTKVGCGEGGCGACTVMLSRFDRACNKVKHFAAVACLVPLCAVHGLAVTTVEGIGSTKTRLHPVQERIAKFHGSQCGFCTPGIVMSMYALLRSTSNPNLEDLAETFQGNLCRCTGYRPILEGLKTFVDCPMGEKCCKRTGVTSDVDTKLVEATMTPYDLSQEPIFPPELKVSTELDRSPIFFKGPRVVWYRPTTLAQLLELKDQFPDARIVTGCTEVGLEMKDKFFSVLIDPTKVKQLFEVKRNDIGLVVGGNLSLSDLEEVLKKEIASIPTHESRLYKVIVEMLGRFSGKQIRNMASMAGNLMTCSPISDLSPILLAANVEITVQSLNGGQRKLNVSDAFFADYRRNVLSPDEVLVNIQLPRTGKNQFFLCFKQSKRRDDDISIVNAAFSVWLSTSNATAGHTIEDIRIAYGGIDKRTRLASQTMWDLERLAWDEKMMEVAAASLTNEFQIASDAPGGVPEYRKSLIVGFFYKAFLAIKRELEGVDEREASAVQNFKTLEPNASQLFQKPSSTQPEIDPVGKPIVHVSALKQATGEAIFTDDIPTFQNELFMSLLLSERAHAKILKIDTTEAEKHPEFVLFLSSKDISDEQNTFSLFAGGNDERVFVKEIVESEGQVIGAVFANSPQTAREIRKSIKVTYEDMKPLILTLEEAISAESFFPDYPIEMSKGEAESIIRESKNVVRGEWRAGKQEHFYLEPQPCIVVPRDSDEIEVFISSQYPTLIQERLAKVLGVPQSKVVVRVKRVGGGFGGKETKGIFYASPLAIGANKLNRPVRCVLDREEDMVCTGTRNPALFKYEAAFDEDGRIMALTAECYMNGGCTLDLSPFVLIKAISIITNAYRVPNFSCSGWLCKTNTPSNTAFRGFGNPQAMMVAENIVRQIAKKLNKDLTDVQKINLYRNGDLTSDDQPLENVTVERCWSECLSNSNYITRKQSISSFNSANRWKKRGISIVPTAFAIGVNHLCLNQAGALVHIYLDGSVLLSHGGVEMGQGLHTKMIQIAARVLGISPDLIHTAEIATDKVPNSTSTAASFSSDLNGPAVLQACQTIKKRLQPYEEQFPDASWERIVEMAYFDRVSLSATGFYKVEGLTFDFRTNSGIYAHYYVYGAAVSEVEIDTLTGDHQVLRTDIVMDLGSSLNPAIDIGQIEGAFAQGYGYYMLEEMLYSPEGRLLTRGPSTYKIPGFGDIPGEFNVALLTDAPNPRAVYSSKAVGEPPLFLASSVFFAVKEAIEAARNEEGLDGADFELHAPATAAKIRMACEDKITAQVRASSTGGNGKSWSVFL